MKPFRTSLATAILVAVGLGPMAASAVAQEDTVEIARIDTLAIVDSLDAAIDTLETHPQDSPDLTGFVFATADGKGSFRLRASIRLNGAWDGSGLGSTDVFDTFLIPVGDSVRFDQAVFFLQATQTRFAFELNRNTGNGIAFGRIETDFRGAGNSLRLRHAYGEYWRFLAGQTWSTFTDVTTLPVTVDLEGPPSSNAVRTPQVRYTVSPGEGWLTALSLEAPKVDATVIDTTVMVAVETFQGFGDIAGRVRRNTAWGHFSLSGVFRSITLQDRDFESQFVPGFGFQLSSRIELGGDDELLFQAIGGQAVSRFIGSLGGKGLDVIRSPLTGRWTAVTSGGGYLTFAHRWYKVAPGIISNFTFGAIGVINEDFEPPDAFNYSFYFSANAFRQVTTGARVGAEFSWGRRVNKDGAGGNAARFSFAAYFDF